MTQLETRRLALASALVAMFAFAPHASAAPPTLDPLPAWNDGPAKQAILGFVARATTPGTGYLPPSERIAVFDNDGTLWPEQPIVQAEFLATEVNALAKKDPSLAQKQPFRAALQRDLRYFATDGEKAVIELLSAVIANTTEQQSADEARRFIATGTYPSLGVPYSSVPYQPMLELLAYLRQNGFQVWISTGGGIDFVRAIAPQLYGVVPDHVIGSSLKKTFVMGQGELRREPHVASINDKEQKAVNIDLHVGAVPALASGNVRSGGDIAMLAYSQTRPGTSLQLMIHHDDPVREFAYEEKDGTSLGAAAANGWTVVSMKNDWRKIFADSRAAPVQTPR